MLAIPRSVVVLYVALSSRLQDKPVNAHVVAPSSTGKNFAINAATQLFPDDAIVKLSAMSPKALIHGADDFRHKTVVLAESNSLALDGNAASLVHSIIEDAKPTLMWSREIRKPDAAQRAGSARKGPRG
jgi:hypothetical protein